MFKFQIQSIIAFGQYKFVLLGKQRRMTCLGRRVDRTACLKAGVLKWMRNSLSHTWLNW